MGEVATRRQELDAGLLRHGVRVLTRSDARLARLVERHGSPPLWGRRRGFRTLVRSVLEQQVSLASAATLFQRIDRSLEGGIATATIARVGVEGLRSLGLTRQKASYVHALAEEIAGGSLRLAELTALDDSAAMARLTRVRGIGPWSASIYLLMALRRADIWPPGDLALHVALARLRRDAQVPRSDEAVAYARRWRPWRSVAARILWQAYLAEAGSPGRRRPVRSTMQQSATI